MPSRPRRSIRDTFPPPPKQVSPPATGQSAPPATAVGGAEMATRGPADTDGDLTAATATTGGHVATESPGTPVTAAMAKRQGQRKFTVLLEAREAVAFTRLLAQVQEQLPTQTVRKSDIVRAWVALTGDDPTLRDQLVQELRNQP